MLNTNTGSNANLKLYRKHRASTARVRSLIATKVHSPASLPLGDPRRLSTVRHTFGTPRGASGSRRETHKLKIIDFFYDSTFSSFYSHLGSNIHLKPFVSQNQSIGSQEIIVKGYLSKVDEQNRKLAIHVGPNKTGVIPIKKTYFDLHPFLKKRKVYNQSKNYFFLLFKTYYQHLISSDLNSFSPAHVSLSGAHWPPISPILSSSPVTPSLMHTIGDLEQTGLAAHSRSTQRLETRSTEEPKSGGSMRSISHLSRIGNTKSMEYFFDFNMYAYVYFLRSYWSYIYSHSVVSSSMFHSDGCSNSRGIRRLSLRERHSISSLLSASSLTTPELLWQKTKWKSRRNSQKTNLIWSLMRAKYHKHPWFFHPVRTPFLSSNNVAGHSSFGQSPGGVYQISYILNHFNPNISIRFDAVHNFFSFNSSFLSPFSFHFSPIPFSENSSHK